MGLIDRGERELTVLYTIPKDFLLECARRLSNSPVFLVGESTIVTHTCNEYFAETHQFSDFFTHVHVGRLLRSESIANSGQPWLRMEETLRRRQREVRPKEDAMKRMDCLLMNTINSRVLPQPTLHAGKERRDIGVGVAKI
jgi:hypothetical protein